MLTAPELTRMAFASRDRSQEIKGCTKLSGFYRRAKSGLPAVCCVTIDAELSLNFLALPQLLVTSRDPIPGPPDHIDRAEPGRDGGEAANYKIRVFAACGRVREEDNGGEALRLRYDERGMLCDLGLVLTTGM